MKITLNKWVESLLMESKRKILYVPMYDDAGNLLEEEDIFFTDQKTLERKQGGDVNEENLLTPSMDGVTPIFDESGNFPVALKTSSQTAYLKVSRKMDKLEPLPIHGGCCPVKSAIFVGAHLRGRRPIFCNSAIRSFMICWREIRTSVFRMICRQVLKEENVMNKLENA